MNIFDFGKRKSDSDDTEEQQLGNSRIMSYIGDVKSGVFAGEAGRASPDSELLEDDSLDGHMQMCPADYIAISDPRRFCLQRETCDKVSGTENVEILVDDDTDWGKGSEIVTPGGQHPPDHREAARHQASLHQGPRMLRAHPGFGHRRDGARVRVRRCRA